MKLASKRDVLTLRDQNAVRRRWLKERLDTLLGPLMERVGLDMWLVIAREYNEDPVLMTLLPSPAMTARRRTMLLFTRRSDGTVERLTLTRYGYGEFYKSAWDPDEQPDQYARLAELIRERDPAVIGINTAPHFAFGDGLSHTEHRLLTAALGPDLSQRLTSAEAMCVGWLERRIPAEMALYPDIVSLGHAIIAEAFSRRTITPGQTTADELVWWMRQRMHDLGLQAWFQPTVDIQAAGQRYDAAQPRRLILPGDLLHCDMGFIYLGLATDQQQHAYVLDEDEEVAPPGLRQALQVGNRLQTIHLKEMRPGRTGNEVLAAVLARAAAEDIDATVYSHPLGYHGHAAGPTIGLWDRQDGVPGSGDYRLYDDTAYSIELNAKVKVHDWLGQAVRIALEEDAVLTNGTCQWLHGRQEELHLV